MSNRLTQAAWGACDSDHTEQNTRPIGQNAQPATIGRACEAADAVTGFQRVRDIDGIADLVSRTATKLTEARRHHSAGFFLVSIGLC
jgi:hypothetical protein